MSVTKVLLEILVVLLAAKAASEVAERARVPAVVGEILAGILIGPSFLGLVSGSDVLRVLGELGVILLLLDVGMEMDLSQMAAVGRASLAVAAVGVVVPFAGGFLAAGALGLQGNEALFVAAALTATSVGITARVFGDLRALASVEARTVLGAAVADDVMGLVILTVVVRIASEGSVSVATVAGIVVIAVAFLAVTTGVGVRLAPPAFAFVARVSRSSGTLVALALAFALAVAELASAAKLAPIVGAFVAGIAVSRSPASGRIRRELTPVGHLFIPVFFLQIGLDANLREFGRPRVLALAGVLLAVAVAGKLASSVGLWGSPGDRLLVGIGMIPRGEVGLIFATIGLRQGVLGPDVYASLLLVVLASTLLTPPVLRLRLLRLRSAPARPGPVVSRPEGGWLEVRPGPGSGSVELAAEPPLGLALPVALEAALRCGDRQPGPALLDWLGRLPDSPLPWERNARRRFFELLSAAGPRSWRFLSVTGVLDRALPELGAAIQRRQVDPHELDPAGALRWPRLERAQALPGLSALKSPELLLLAAVVLDATDGDASAVATARRIVQRLDLGAAAEQAVAGLVADADLLPAAVRRADSLTEEAVLQLAVHLRSTEQAAALFLLTETGDAMRPWEKERLRELEARVRLTLAHPELTGRTAANAVEQRRSAASRLTTGTAVLDRIAAAPRAYVLATQPADLARQAALCEPPPRGDQVRVDVEPLAPGRWRVDVVARDRIGLLAADTDALAEESLDVLEATIATWADGCGLASFVVTAPVEPEVAALAEGVRRSVHRPRPGSSLPDAVVSFDGQASPWHTICRVEAPDRTGLLHAVTSALAASGASVHSARVTTVGGRAVDVFELTDRNGNKLTPPIEDAVRRALASGAPAARRGPARWLGFAPRSRNGTTHDGRKDDTKLKQGGHRPETPPS